MSFNQTQPNGRTVSLDYQYDARSAGSIDSGRSSIRSGGSGDSGSSSTRSSDSSSASDAEHITHTARLPYSRTAPTHNKWDIVGAIILATLAVGMLALILELVAHHQDLAWNGIVRGDQPFPDIGKEYFKNIMIHLDRDQKALDAIVKLMLRDENHELVALIFLVLYLVLITVAAVLYSQGEGMDRTVIGYIHGIGGLFMFVSAILILVSDLHIDSAHQSAAVELRKYVDDFDGADNPTIPPENYVLIKKQAGELAIIQDLCALSQSQNGRYSALYSDIFILIDDESYTSSDLHQLGFCSLETVKFAAFFVCLLFAIFSIGIPGLVYYKSRRLRMGLGAAKVHPTMKNGPKEMKKAPAFGYGQQENYDKLNENYNTEGFDPRYPPKPPRADLGIIGQPETGRNSTSKRMSNPARKSLPTPKKLSIEDSKYAKFHEGFLDDEEGKTSSLDSMEPRIFSSVTSTDSEATTRNK